MPIETRTTDGLLEGQFIRFFTSYAMYFNKRHKRNGNLFTRPFKRVEIENDGHLLHGVYYIHANPVKHKTRKEFFTYPWSSYQILLSEEPTRLARTEVLQWFDGRDGFIKYHREAFENDKDDIEYFFE
ncbi:MAG: hypothetical protein KDC85_23400 [Saprospiraceae bacterium]|nr:hypothetical protein [Saprospiraceae bacterium]MCB9326321.1 hypothetical protein [Lewinellaceae bacterium]